MKFVCLGYIDEKWAESLPRRELEALMDECLTYDDRLRERGHFAGGEALEVDASAFRRAAGTGE